jgi:hypothetical protein
LLIKHGNDAPLHVAVRIGEFAVAKVQLALGAGWRSPAAWMNWMRSGATNNSRKIC